MKKTVKALTSNSLPEAMKQLNAKAGQGKMTTVRFDNELAARLIDLMAQASALHGFTVTKSDIIKSALLLGLPQLEANIKRFKQSA